VRKTFYLKILIIILILAGGFFFIKIRVNDNLIGKIGEEKLLIGAINMQIKTDNCYGNNNINPETATVKIINQFLESAVLKSAFDLEPSEADLKEKSSIIDRDTKEPKILNCVKNVFGENIDSYLRLYVSPTLINPELHRQFNASEDIKKEEIEKIEKARDSLKQGEGLEKLEGYEKFEILKSIELPETLQAPLPELPQNPLIEKVLKNLKPGETWPNIIEDDSSLKIVRLLSEDENKYYCDGVIIPKKQFDQWFKDYATNNIKMEIKDEQLLSQIRQDYPTLWWLEIVNK
jgi:hypothetical protein